MLIRIVSILFPLFAITALGYFVGRRMKPDLSHANKLNMDVFVPALVFGALVSKDFRLGEYLPLLFAIQYRLLDVPLHWMAKFAIAVLATFALSFVSYRLVVRNTLVGRLLNGKHAKTHDSSR